MKRLGKGLSAIIGPRLVPTVTITPGQTPTTPVPAAALASSTAPPTVEAAPAGDIVKSLPIELVIPNPRQPRKTFDDARLAELADSIRTSGILQPIVVRKIPGKSYEIVAGERRWRAAKVANLTTVPALVKEVTDAESLELALVENLQREDLNPIERAEAYQQYLHTFRVHADTLARRLGESRANISNYVRLLTLAEELQTAVRSGELSMGHARALAGIKEPERQLQLGRLALRKGLSVRQLEGFTQDAPATSPLPPAPKKPLARHMEQVEAAFRKSTGLPVTVRPGRSKNSGKLVISYRTLEEFDNLAKRLGAAEFLE